MNRITKVTALLLFALITGSAQAQLYKIEDAVSDGNFKRVVKLAENFMDDKEMKKKPEVYYYHAMGLYELSLDPYFFDENPDAMKTAIKSIYKGLKKDDDSAVLHGDFSDLLEDITKRYNELAYDQYSINKMSRAFKMYTQSYGLNQNRTALWMSGKTALALEDTAHTDSTYTRLIALYNADTKNEVEDPEQELDPHVYFINKYWAKADYDSADYYLENARYVFGRDPKIDFYQKRVSMDRINAMPPSMLMMEYLRTNLEYFPTDTNFLHKENALYVYMMKNHIVGERYDMVDTLLRAFINSKVERSKSKQAAEIKQGDMFVTEKSENVLWKLAEYYHTYRHPVSSEFILDRYIHMTAKKDTAPEVLARWGVIAEYTIRTKELPFAIFVLQQAIEKTDQSEELLALRSKLLAERENHKLNVGETEALYDLMKDEYAAYPDPDHQERYQNLGEKYIELLVKNVRFSTAMHIMAELMEDFPEGDFSEQLRYLAQEDFYQNYFQTKTKGQDASGQVVELFEWNGSVSRCDAGQLEPDIQEKVLARINYFRRNAGVPEVFFDATTNEYCQEAALMMESNRRLDHEPTKNWRCYSADGAYAAKHSLLVQKAHTTLAVTSLMADQQNPTVGNRRWLLYPNGQIYGHGSTENYAVIWALDDSGSTDTAEYMEKAVCWPPNGYVPQMMLFKHWSFSLYQNLDSAQVVVKQDGNEIPVKIEKYVEGYGAPTLVFVPEINMAELPAKSIFEVEVTLSNGSQYSYTVHTFDYDPNKL